MWSSVVFEPHFEQHVFAKYREANGVMIPVDDGTPRVYTCRYTYDAFGRDDLIPSLVRLVSRASKVKDYRPACKKWIRDNGFLTTPVTQLPEVGERLDVFWKEAVTLAELWRMHAQAANRDVEALKRYVEVTIERLSPDEIEHEEFLWGKGNNARVCVSGLFEGAFGVRLKDLEEDPLAPYQFAIMHYVAKKVTYNIGAVHFDYVSLEKQLASEMGETDTFLIRACVVPLNLLGALYLKFLGHLTKRQKVCPTCWQSFSPGRRDQVFCSSSCRYTHHSRIRRGLEKE